MKNLLKTKTFWVGLVDVIASVGAFYMGEMTLAQFIPAAMMGLAIITGRHAFAKGK